MSALQYRITQSRRRVLSRSVALVCIMAALIVACMKDLNHPAPPAAQSSPTPLPTGAATVYWRHPNNPDIYGYNIYRAESESGPFVKVNAEIIRPNPHVPNQQYTDRGLQEGKIYYYYIEAQHYAGGLKEKITPVTPVIVGKPWAKTNE
jgi:hypothetical protein